MNSAKTTSSRTWGCKTVEEFVGEIVAVNHAWHSAKERYDPSSHVCGALRRLKALKQVSLLRAHEGKVYLREHTTDEHTEPHYSVRLLEKMPQYLILACAG